MQIKIYLEFLMGQNKDVVKRTKVAGGVIIRVENELDKLLVIRRSKTDTWSGTWEFPRGHAKDNESLIQALKREVKEETGLDIIPIKFIDKFMYLADQGTRETTQYNYLCKMKDPNQKVKLSKEHDAFNWLTGMGEVELNVPPEMKKTISRVFNTKERIVIYPEKNEKISE